MHDEMEILQVLRGPGRQLLGGPDLLPRARGLQPGPDGLPAAHRGRQGRPDHPGHRQPQRHLAGRLGPLRPADPGCRRRCARAERLLRRHRPRHDRRRASNTRYLELVGDVRESVSIPLAVKIGPYFSSLPNMARRLVRAGADGLVLFNRFLQPDIDLETRCRHARTSSSAPATSSACRCAGSPSSAASSDTSLAATTGVHTAEDVIKLLLAGADVTMIASALYKRRPGPRPDPARGRPDLAGGEGIPVRSSR